MYGFIRVLGLTTALCGLGVAGSELATVTWDAPAGVVVGALGDVFAPGPLAAMSGNRNEGERLDALAVSFKDVRGPLAISVGMVDGRVLGVLRGPIQRTYDSGPPLSLHS